mgnify:FL=1
MVATKRIEPPFKPAIKDDVDVSNFSTEFTNMAAADSPAVAAPDNMADVFRVTYNTSILSVHHRC